MTRMMASVVGIVLAAGGPATAQEDFYDGKTIELYIGFGPGGNYDAYARLLAQHMGEHIPGNPEIVPFNMEGAGSMRLANWLYNVAPKDGTVFGTISRAVPFYPLIGEDAAAAQFDPTQFGWIGSANDETSTCVVWEGAGVESVEDLKETSVIMGGDGPTADGEQFARVMNDVLGTQIDIITGYGGGNDINLAMERGEVNARCGWSWSSVKSSHQDWLDSGQIDVLIQMGSGRHPDLPDTPTLSELVDDPEDQKLVDLILARQPLGRPYVAPPEVPEERLQILQDAFIATMQDPDFLAAADQARLEINPLAGEEVAAIIERVYSNASDELVARAKGILTPQ